MKQLSESDDLPEDEYKRRNSLDRRAFRPVDPLAVNVQPEWDGNLALEDGRVELVRERLRHGVRCVATVVGGGGGEEASPGAMGSD